MNDTKCCPKFDPAPWDEKFFTWSKKRFVKDKVFTLFYMPVNFGSVIKKLIGKITAADASSQDWIGLSEHISKWRMDIYVAVTKEVPNVENVQLSGKYFSKVYEGPYKNCGQWHKDFTGLLASKNLTCSKRYAWYTTCPKCAKEFGKNYVVLIAELQ